jgi:hypothetical protein
MPVRSYCLASLLASLLAAPALAQELSGEGQYFYIPSETTVTFVGEHYWLRTTMPDNWAYGTSPSEDGMQLMISGDPEAAALSSDLITFTEKRAFDNWPAKHSASWAADAYRDWEVGYMQTEGVDAGMYQLHDVSRGETSVGGKTLYTLKYRQHMASADGNDLVIHAHLFLYFPDAYKSTRRFYWIHYQHLCEEGEQEQLLMEIVDGLLSALTTDMGTAPRQSSVTWSSLDDTYVAINALGENRTHFFSNDPERICFRFSIDGIWATMNMPGTFAGPNGFDAIAVELVGAFELTDFPGDDLLERLINGKRELLQYEAAGEVRIREIRDMENVYPGARQVFYEVPYEALPGLTATSTMSFYVADVTTGWAALVHASRNMKSGDDDLAKAVLESIRLSDDSDCFHDEISELLR